MPTTISEAVGTTHAALEAEGAFDAFVDLDSKLYIDPHLLSSTRIPEFRNSYQRFQNHFENVIRVLRQSRSPNDLMFRSAVGLMRFREIPSTGLGYARTNTRGSAIGSGLATALCTLAKEIIDAGIADPTIFELVGLLQDGIGADRISDMTAAIILPDLLRFTERVAKKLQLPTRMHAIGGDLYALPVYKRSKQIVILIPKVLLRDLPVADSWDDIDEVSSHNEELRGKVNPIIGDSWRQATRRLKKHEFRSVLLENPDLIRDLLDQYKAKPGESYDFKKDPRGYRVWYFLTREILDEAPPLDLSVSPDDEATVEIVQRICLRFKELIEHNRLYQVLYNDNGTLRHERISQATFFTVADAYCSANNLDVTPEANAGMGPVDFKFSRGYHSRINVEVKLSSNGKLEHGYSVQLPIYDNAEKSFHSILLILQVGDHAKRIHAVQQARDQAITSGKRAPDVIIVDARPRKSASHA